jgi:formylglycine-generating enzyme required for sulfatase activity
MTEARQNEKDDIPPVNTVTSDTIGGDKIGGDKIIGDKIGGDKFVYNITQTGPPPKPHLSYEPETLLIPAGPFLIGSSQDDPAESPQHSIDLPDFYIGRFPVTNEQFARFIWETDQTAPWPLLWDGNSPPEDRLNHPVTGVTWYEAFEYCQWLSQQSGRTYTLPSEAQWEKAARTTDGRLYPWGNDWQDGRCHQGPDTAPVDAYPAQNEYGCYDLVGSAREWTSTIWGRLPNAPDGRYQYPWANDQREDQSAPPSLRRIYRGGWADNPHDFRCSARDAFLPDKPGPKRHRHSFRVILLPT